MQSSKYSSNPFLAASAREARAVTPFSLMIEIPVEMRFDSLGKAV
jgi:hypothetical protein